MWKAFWTAGAVTLVAAVTVAGGAMPGEGSVPDPVEVVGGARWTDGNSVRLLARPDDAWRARLDIVERATSNIHITTFSWHNDHYGKLYREKLIDVIARKKRENPDFEVRILVDSTARGVFDASFSRLKAAGAVVRSFNPGTWGIAPMYDLRMHDKMIIADGRYAIVGGRNISDEYFDGQRWWLDLGVAVEGDAVHDLQMNFLKSWELSNYLGQPLRLPLPLEVLERRVYTFLTTGRFPGGRSPLSKYLDDRYFPQVDSTGDGIEVAILYDNPLVRTTAVSTELLTRLVSAARSEIDLMTPFPNLPHELTEAISDAAARGVAVRLFINGADAAIRRGPFLLAGLPTVIELYRAGVEVWAWEGNGHIDQLIEDGGCSPDILPPRALHGKLARIDDRLAIVHSSNFNIRSTYYNTEAGALVRDADFNGELERLLDELISLHDLRVECGDGLADLTIERIVRRLDDHDVEEFLRLLGRKQRLLDEMGVIW